MTNHLERDPLDWLVLISFALVMSDAEKIYEGVPGGGDLVAWFGRVPSFHDAEIISLALNRRSPSTISIHAWNATQQVDDRGYLILDKHAVVKFVFEDMIDIRLNDFSHQNVIFGLQLRLCAGAPGSRLFR